MIIIKVNGGLGNQLFQYALYLWCNQCISHSSMLDVYEYNVKTIHAGFNLPTILSNSEKLNIVQDDSCDKFHNYHILKRVLLKLSGHYGSHYFEQYFNDTKELFSFLASDPQIAYLEGYWQTADIIRPVKDKLKSDVIHAIELPLGFNNRNILSKILETQSVAVHIRCGDYINTKTNKRLYGEICTEKYYQSAIDYIANNLPNKPTFFVFSDDIERAKHIIDREQIYKFIYVEGNTGDNAFIDILLMRECRNHIIANSSFSWWAAVLSTNNGITIMPKKWNNQLSENLLAFPGNILIDEKGNLV